MARFDLETTPEVKTKLVKMAKEGKRSMTGREEVKVGPGGREEVKVGPGGREEVKVGERGALQSTDLA